MNIENRSPLAVVILAAGLGKRMLNPDLPKVLVELSGKPLIGYVLEQAEQLRPERAILIVGYQKDKVIDYVNSIWNGRAEFAEQHPPLGTGHAVEQSRGALKSFKGDVLILCGDVPLLKATTLKKFIESHRIANSDVSVLSTYAPDPKGYGRIVRSSDGIFEEIVEEKDATLEIKRINEINSGVFCIESGKLFDALKEVRNDNAQGEYYLTDIISILRSQEAKATAFPLADFDELQGINSPDDLARAEKLLETIENI